MSTLLHLAVSPSGERSISRSISNEYIAAFIAANPEGKIITRDLAKTPVDHLDSETISATYTPAEVRTEDQHRRHENRIELAYEIRKVDEILVSTPMWNWNIPSVLKAYLDQIIVPGILMGKGENDSLNAKKVTIIVSQGGSYSSDSRIGWDFLTGYLKHVFTVLGATDIQVVVSEFGLAGVAPGMESLVEKKDASITAAKEAVRIRAAA
jgi:FMN-dependent NADH-azoreductase